jgi:hypothetical protein
LENTFQEKSWKIWKIWTLNIVFLKFSNFFPETCIFQLFYDNFIFPLFPSVKSQKFSQKKVGKSLRIPFSRKKWKNRNFKKKDGKSGKIKLSKKLKNTTFRKKVGKFEKYNVKQWFTWVWNNETFIRSEDGVAKSMRRWYFQQRDHGGRAESARMTRKTLLRKIRLCNVLEPRMLFGFSHDLEGQAFYMSWGKSRK